MSMIKWHDPFDLVTDDDVFDLLDDYEQDLLEQYERVAKFFLVFAEREDEKNAYFYLRTLNQLLQKLSYA